MAKSFGPKFNGFDWILYSSGSTSKIQPKQYTLISSNFFSRFFLISFCYLVYFFTLIPNKLNIVNMKNLEFLSYSSKTIRKISRLAATLGTHILVNSSVNSQRISKILVFGLIRKSKWWQNILYQNLMGLTEFSIHRAQKAKISQNQTHRFYQKFFLQFLKISFYYLVYFLTLIPKN